MKEIKPKFRTLRVRYIVDENGKLPTYSTSGSAGCDIYAAEDGDIKPGMIRLVKTGLKIAIPKGFELQIRPRSGLALKQSITVLNSPGTIDSDYRGEIGIILVNFGSETFKFAKGDRIAQGVFAPYKVAEFIKSDNLDETDRGEGGFGHSGVK